VNLNRGDPVEKTFGLFLLQVGFVGAVVMSSDLRGESGTSDPIAKLISERQARETRTDSTVSPPTTTSTSTFDPWSHGPPGESPVPDPPDR